MEYGYFTWAASVRRMWEEAGVAHDLGTYDGGKLPEMDDDARLADIESRGRAGKCYHDEDVVFLIQLVRRLRAENEELREGRGRWPSI